MWQLTSWFYPSHLLLWRKLLLCFLTFTALKTAWFSPKIFAKIIKTFVQVLYVHVHLFRKIYSGLNHYVDGGGSIKITNSCIENLRQLFSQAKLQRFEFCCALKYIHSLISKNELVFKLPMKVAEKHFQNSKSFDLIRTKGT